MSGKRMEIADVVGELADGMTVGIGGWGSRRKPMALVRAIARSSLRDLTVVSFGGPDVGLLVAAGKVARLVAGFVTLDSVAYDPWFSRVRQAGGLWVSEYDEGMLATALDAGAKRVPFLPLRAGMGSDVPVVNPQLRTVRSPYGDGEELLAVPAVELDVALVHLNRADARGNAQYLGPDPYFDDVLCRAAGKRFVSCERVVATSALASAGPVQSLVINRSMTDGVVEAPRGAHFTSCVPDYGRDEAFQAAYVRAGRDPERWAEFAARFLAGDEAEYQQAVDRFAAEVAV